MRHRMVFSPALPSRMPIHRRELLLAGASLPFLTSCASSTAVLSQRSVGDLAQEFSVCSAAYAIVRAGRVAELEGVSGCASAAASSQASGAEVYQAASLSKPVVAYAALTLALQGRLDLDAPVSQYLPHGYQHFHSVLARSPEDAHDTVAPEVLARVRVAHLLQPRFQGVCNGLGGIQRWLCAADQQRPWHAAGSFAGAHRAARRAQGL